MKLTQNTSIKKKQHKNTMNEAYKFKKIIDNRQEITQHGPYNEARKKSWHIFILRILSKDENTRN